MRYRSERGKGEYKSQREEGEKLDKGRGMREG